MTKAISGGKGENTEPEAVSPRLGARDVYHRIREMILSFELYPGTRVTETELADLFGVSRTPVREALQKLEVEGFLSIRPKQGCFIRDLDIEELSEYYRVRITLEMLAIDTACVMMTTKELENLAQIWNPEKLSATESGLGSMDEKDEDFHLAIARGSGNRVLVNYLSDINNRIRIIRRMDFTDYDRIGRTYREHYAIIQHMLQRNAEKAKIELRMHILRSEEFAKTLTLTQLARRKAFARKFPQTFDR